MNSRSLFVVGALAALATLAYGDVQRAQLAWTAAFSMLVVTGLAGLILVFVLELVHAKWWLAVRAPFLAVARLPLIIPLFFVPVAAFRSPGFVVRGFLYCAVWAVLAALARRRLSGSLAAAGIIVIAFTLTAASFDWFMAIQPGFTSSLYGVWMFAEGFCGAMAAVSIGARFAKLPDGVGPDHFGAIGRLLLCALMVWAYLGFFQLLLVWLPDLPREVTFFTARVEGGWAIVSGLLVARFVVALVALLLRDFKRTPRGLAMIGAFLIVTQALDCAWLILPSAGARLSPLDALPFIAVIALAAGFAARTRIAPVPLDAALRYRSP